jgi:hypothetical protein
MEVKRVTFRFDAEMALSLPPTLDLTFYNAAHPEKEREKNKNLRGA